MSIRLDHLFVITTPGAAVADRIVELGFVEGSVNTHPGQGTSNRRFFLNGFTLELLYVSDVSEAKNGAGQCLEILERSGNSEASPFGLVVRVIEGDTVPTFPSWQYFPDYFNGEMCFYVGENSDQLPEPLCICMPPSLPMAKDVPDEYANPDWLLTRVDINVPVVQASAVLVQFAAMENVFVHLGKPHRVVLEFNHATAGLSVDLSSDIPVILKW